MSRTTRCLFALGLSVSLAAACGDDDDGGFGGGSGGRAGSGGSAGRGGSAGTGGDAGAAGSGGDAGSGGTGGSGTGGTGGSTGGTGGSSAGTGGSGEEPPDAGPDAAPDGGGEEPADGGVEPIACPDLDDALDDADGANTQGIIIARVVFDGTDVTVTFKAINGDFNFAAPLALCTGSEAGDCDEDVQELGTVLGDGGIGDLLEGETVEFTTSLLGTTPVTAAAGELALVNGQPGDDDEPIIRAYINWGGYLSLPPTLGDDDDLATEAVEEGVWEDVEDTIEVNGQTTIYADGDITNENGFGVCTQEP